MIVCMPVVYVHVMSLDYGSYPKKSQVIHSSECKLSPKIATKLVTIEHILLHQG